MSRTHVPTSHQSPVTSHWSLGVTLIELLVLARSLAISSRSVRSVLLDEDRHELVIEETLEQDEPRRVRLPETVDVSLEGGAAGTGRGGFQPTGALSTPSATISLVSGTKRQTIAKIQ